MLGEIIGSVLSGALSQAGNRKAANQGVAAINAGQDYVRNSPLGTVYQPGGAQAFQQQQNLLGLGDNPQGAQTAYDNFLGSTGYQTALKGGNDAITSSMAAGLGNKSGAADKARARFGTGLARNYFDNYFSQLGGQAQAGQNATNFLAQSATNAAGDTAAIRTGQYQNKGNIGAGMVSNIFGQAAKSAGAGTGGVVGKVLGSIF